jgi:hypothetical protein
LQSWRSVVTLRFHADADPADDADTPADADGDDTDVGDGADDTTDQTDNTVCVDDTTDADKDGSCPLYAVFLRDNMSPTSCNQTIL